MQKSWLCKTRSLVIALLLMVSAANLPSSSDAQSKRWKLKAKPLTSDELTNSIAMFRDHKRQYRCNWLREKLNLYIEYINDAARSQTIPPRLLVAIIGNELADIKKDDVRQDYFLYLTRGEYRNLLEQFNPVGGVKIDGPLIHVPGLGEFKIGTELVRDIGLQSFGIAQITPLTAIRYRGFNFPKSGVLNDHERHFLVAYRLLDRPTSIYTAARIVRGILGEIEVYQKNTWVRSFLAPGRRFNQDAIYDAIFVPDNLARNIRKKQAYQEIMVAKMVAGVYNNGDPLLLSRRPENSIVAVFRNTIDHATNASFLANDLAFNDCGLALQTVDTIQKRKGCDWKFYGQKQGYQCLCVDPNFRMGSPVHQRDGRVCGPKPR